MSVGRLRRSLASAAHRGPRATAGRASQVVRARLEGLRPTRLPDLPPDLAVPAIAPTAGLEEQEATVAALRERWPEDEIETKRAADAICERRFDLLGYRDLDFGDPVDWGLDPVSGLRAPLDGHWSTIDYLDSSTVGDHKVIWELNRHQHLVTLGRAWWYTGDDRYADRFVADLDEWMTANPPKLGVNWASSLEVALRAIAWLWAGWLFREARQFDEPMRRRLAAFLVLSGEHVERYLSTWFSPNTHLTGEALGLAYLGASLPRSRAADRWRRRGISVLLRELDRQLLADGVYFEQASYYHRYTADIYSHLWILGERHGWSLPGLRTRLEALLDHLMHITRPDGSSPLIGDDDGGRLMTLDARAPDDFRATLCTGAGLLDRADFRFVAREPSPESLWLLGPDRFARLEEQPARMPETRGRGFETGGYYVIRSDWSEDADYLLFRCGPHGGLRGGHAHADALSVELALNGRRWLVDPGTGSYSEPTLRERFRVTAAHNTVTVDGRSSCTPDGPFGWSRTATSTCRAFAFGDRFAFLRGAHDGFGALTDGGVHERTVLFLPGEYLWLQDTFTAPSAHCVEAGFRFPPGVRLETEAALLTARFADGTADETLRLESAHDGRWSLAEEAVSPVYGRVLDAPAARLVGRTPPTARFLTLIRSGPAGAAPAVELDPETGARIIRLPSPAGEDVLIEGGARPVTVDDLTTDFEWTWVRRGPDGTVAGIVAIAGRRLEIEDAASLESVCALPWIEVWIEGGVAVVGTPSTEPLGLQVPGHRILHGGRTVAQAGDGRAIASGVGTTPAAP